MPKLLMSLLLFLCFSLSLSATPGQIGRARSPIKGRYIVLLSETDSVSPSVRAAEAATRFGGKVTAVWSSAVRGFAVEMSEAQATALSYSPHVQSIEEDAYGTILTTQPLDTQLWGLDRIDQHFTPPDGSFTYCQDGTGVNVYIVDTGVWYMHSEFDLLTGGSNRVEPGMDFCSGGVCVGQADNPCNAGDPSLPWPLGGHGTKVASVAAGLTYGAAKNARIIPVRAGDCRGIFASSWVISAVDWVDADHQAGEPAVMNCSFKVDKTDTHADAVTQAINGAINDGIIVVVGAGNSNESASNTLLPNISGAITVGATDRYDSRWVDSATVGSNRGSKVDVFAPGDSIRVAEITSTDATVRNSGTSLSAPFVTGVVAQYLQSHPTATPAEVFSWVVSSATPGVLTNLGVGSPNLLLYSYCNP